MRHEYRDLRLKQLTLALSAFRDATQVPRPRLGWLRAIREAGEKKMTFEELAIGIVDGVVASVDRNGELDPGCRLDAVATVAELISTYSAAEREPMECGHPTACMEEVPDESTKSHYADAAHESVWECAWCVERERHEAEVTVLVNKWRKPVASSTPQNEAVYNQCADELAYILTSRKG